MDNTVYEVMKRHKKILGTDRPTGLKYTRDRFHGHVWVLPATTLGNTVADSIDGQLAELARHMDQKKVGPGR